MSSRKNCVNVLMEEPQDMVTDGMDVRSATDFEGPTEQLHEESDQSTKELFDMLKAAREPLSERSNSSVWEMASNIASSGCEYNRAQECVDKLSSLFSELTDEETVATRIFDGTKKLLKALELPHEKIHVCPDGCMLFWKENEALDKCPKCNKGRWKHSFKGRRVPKKVLIYFPITPRLQRLYATEEVAKKMRWHSENPRVTGKMAHPSDGEEWKHLDVTYPDFAKDPRNVRLGLYAERFAPYGGESYSCWPVVLTPYNLPPHLCMKREFMFLSLIIPGPKTPKGNFNVYMQPLVEELKFLWENGSLTYDVFKKQNFTMKAAVLWTISDFPTHGMLSGRSTAGKLACPYCLDKTNAFRLEYSRKVSWFDCHRQFLPQDHAFRNNKTAFFKDRVDHRTPPPRLSGQQLWDVASKLPKATDPTMQKSTIKGWVLQSILWELPYWKDLHIRNHLDVMDIERNFFAQLMQTIMDVRGRTSDTVNARKDMSLYCKRPTLEVVINANGEETLPEAPYVLDEPSRKVLCEWVKQLKFPDEYAPNLSGCVDLCKLRFFGMKIHDCHVFMERLIPVAFKNLLPVDIWNAVTEISQFFRDLCSSTIQVDDMCRLENNIPEIICKLERIFPPAFFSTMEHLPIHLPYEAKVGGPVQYRWMYPFKWFLNRLKRRMGTKTWVEGSIRGAYLLEEISSFFALNFEERGDAPHSIPRDMNSGIDPTLPEAFRCNTSCKTSCETTRHVDDQERIRAHLYVLSNCKILGEYERAFEDHIMQVHPNTSRDAVWSKYEETFIEWFRAYVSERHVEDDVVRALAMGPSRVVNTYQQCHSNGYDFHTYEYGKDKYTMNYCVCVRSPDDIEYYGILEEIVELCYNGVRGEYKTVLFKCDWLDTPTGVNVHEQYKLVEVNSTKKYPKYDPFVLAYQVQQVYFTSSPSLKNDKSHWWAVLRTKPRSAVDAPVSSRFFQEESAVDPPCLSLPEVDERDSEPDSDEVQVLDDAHPMYVDESQFDDEEDLQENESEHDEMYTDEEDDEEYGVPREDEEDSQGSGSEHNNEENDGNGSKNCPTR